MNFKRIIVAVDGSATAEKAFNEALQLMTSLQAKLCLVYVVDVFPAFNLASGVDFDRCRELIKESGQAILDRLKLLAQVNNVLVETRLFEIYDASKKVSEKIIECAQAWGADLIMIGTHGRRGFRRLILGSVAEETIRLSPVPVLLVRALDIEEKQKKHLPFARIMVAMDGSETSFLALTCAIALAKTLGASLCVLHVANEFPGKDFIFARQLVKYAENLAKIGGEILAKSLQVCRDNDIAAEALLIELTDASGTIADKINEATMIKNSDLLVIGTHGRKGLNRFLLGSVAEETARTALIPVLLIRAQEQENEQ